MYITEKEKTATEKSGMYPFGEKKCPGIELARAPLKRAEFGKKSVKKFSFAFLCLRNK